MCEHWSVIAPATVELRQDILEQVEVAEDYICSSCGTHCRFCVTYPKHRAEIMVIELERLRWRRSYVIEKRRLVRTGVAMQQ